MTRSFGRVMPATLGPTAGLHARKLSASASRAAPEVRPRRSRLTIDKWSLICVYMQSAAAEDRVFHALADPSRRAIFESLTRGEAAVNELTARFAISQPAVSQHLANLKSAGLVRGRREGRRVYYRVEPRGMRPLSDWVARYRAFWTERVERLELLLEKMDR